MALLDWKDDYLLGIDELDYEHKDLFDCVNRLHTQCANSAWEPALVTDCLGQLHARLSAHFALEEKVMREKRNPHYAKHKAAHDQFLDEVTEIVSGYHDDVEKANIEALATRVREWIVNHITTFDRQLIERGD